jgi:hypothetical protein
VVPIRAAVPWALLLGLAIMSPAPAQTPRPAPNADAAVHAEILNLRETIRAAVAAKDRAALERFYADNFIHMRDSGRVDLKGGRIALLLSGASAIETAPEDEFVVQSYGSGTAAATGVSRIVDGATDRAARFRWLTVYVRDGADWRVALSQASRIVGRR